MDNIGVNEKLSQILRERNIDLKRASEYTGISQTSLCAILCGKRPVYADEIVAICDYVRVDLRLFLEKMDS